MYFTRVRVIQLILIEMKMNTKMNSKMNTKMSMKNQSIRLRTMATIGLIFGVGTFTLLMEIMECQRYVFCPLRMNLMTSHLESVICHLSLQYTYL